MTNTRTSKKRLRSGFTTGTAAAAAAKAALYVLAGKSVPLVVSIRLLTDAWLDIKVHECVSGIDENGKPYALCTVIKDAGDDPDVTNRAEIGSKVWFTDDPDNISITGGTGVGTITRPGLELPPGEPAINPGPRQMICEAVNDVRNRKGIKKGVHVEIFVPCGEEIAKKTLNARLGIVGGISILGTTGVVTPMSHEAYIATIEAGLSVAKATGIDTVVLTTGRRSERHAMGFLPDMAEEAFIQIGDYFSRSIELAVEKGLQKVILAAFFGKAVKMAQGAGHTHARTSRLSMAHLARVVAGAGGDGEVIANANTAREAFFIIEKECPVILDIIASQAAENALGFSGGGISVRMILFDFSGKVAADKTIEKENL